jgi:hypothetical protein
MSGGEKTIAKDACTDVSSTAVGKHTFRALFCERLHCLPSDYEERVFRACLYRHAKLVAPVLRKMKPDLFTRDFKFIGYLGETTEPIQAIECALDYQDANFAARSFLRTVCRIRVSGRKAVALARQLFAITQ